MSSSVPLIKHGQLLCAMILLAAGQQLFAQQPHEVIRLAKEFNLTPAGSNPANLIVHNGKLYFAATDGTHGFELWQAKRHIFTHNC